MITLLLEDYQIAGTPVVQGLLYAKNPFSPVHFTKRKTLHFKQNADRKKMPLNRLCTSKIIIQKKQ